MPIIFIDSTMLPPPFISCLCKNKEMKIAKSTNTISFPSKPNEYLSKKKNPSWCSRLIKILRLQHPNSSKRVKLKKNQLTIVTKTGLFGFFFFIKLNHKTFSYISGWNSRAKNADLNACDKCCYVYESGFNKKFCHPLSSIIVLF